MYTDAEKYGLDNEDEEIEFEYNMDISHYSESDENENALWDDKNDTADTETDKPPQKARKKLPLMNTYTKEAVMVFPLITVWQGRTVLTRYFVPQTVSIQRSYSDQRI